MKTTVINKYILLYNSIYSTRFHVVMSHQILYVRQNLSVDTTFFAVQQGEGRGS